MGSSCSSSQMTALFAKVAKLHDDGEKMVGKLAVEQIEKVKKKIQALKDKGAAAVKVAVIKARLAANKAVKDVLDKVKAKTDAARAVLDKARAKGLKALADVRARKAVGCCRRAGRTRCRVVVDRLYNSRCCHMIHLE